MGFYGVEGGEILVMVDLATRETRLEFLKYQKQDKLSHTLLNRIVCPKGVPLFIRSENAPQHMQGAARDTCKCLGIQQIVTGGHNPRGNSISAPFVNEPTRQLDLSCESSLIMITSTLKIYCQRLSTPLTVPSIRQ
jgi:hypothetical protein